jgi:hypothetical protein
MKPSPESKPKQKSKKAIVGPTTTRRKVIVVA